MRLEWPHLCVIQCRFRRVKDRDHWYMYVLNYDLYNVCLYPTYHNHTCDGIVTCKDIALLLTFFEEINKVLQTKIYCSVVMNR